MHATDIGSVVITLRNLNNYIMKNITSKDINKNDVVLLRDTGWKATILDGYKNRTTRLAEVEGFFTEIGSIYASDIHSVFRNGTWIPVNHVGA
jgi:hypothetical protein